MKLIVNKNELEVPDGITLGEYLNNNFSGNMVGMAIAVNNQVIARSNWLNFSLKEKDNILIITATAGG